MMARRPTTSSAVDAVAPRPASKQEQHPAQHRRVLQEVDLLAHGLTGWDAPDIVEDRREHAQQREEGQGGPARLPASQDRETRSKLDCDRDCGEKLRKRKRVLGNVARRSLESTDLAVAGKDEDRGEKHAGQERDRVLAIAYRALDRFERERRAMIDRAPDIGASERAH